jgi:3-hydroxyacyl-CoA dehydrogenase
VHREIDKLVSKNRLSNERASDIKALVAGSLTMEAFADAGFVIEAVFEEMSVKQKVFADIEAAVAADCVMATNTSSLSVTEMAARLAHPERVVGFHFFNPVAGPLLEIVRGRRTGDVALAGAFDVARGLRKTAVLVTDAPGFVVNRLLIRFLCEILLTIDEGTPFTIADSAMNPVGLPMSPLALLQLVGPAVALHVMESLHAAFPERFQVSENLRRMVAAGTTGIYLAQGGRPRVDPDAVEDLVELMAIGGQEYLFYKAFPINVAIIRGTTADPDGNITMEREALTCDTLSLATAAHNSGGLVIAQVERIAEVGTLHPRQVKIPGTIVDCIVVASTVKNHPQTLATSFNPAYAAEVRLPLASLQLMPMSARKILARRATMELAPEQCGQPRRRNPRRGRVGGRRGERHRPDDHDNRAGHHRWRPSRRLRLRRGVQPSGVARHAVPVRPLRRRRTRRGLPRSRASRQTAQPERVEVRPPPRRRGWLREHQPERQEGLPSTTATSRSLAVNVPRNSTITSMVHMPGRCSPSRNRPAARSSWEPSPTNSREPPPGRPRRDQLPQGGHGTGDRRGEFGPPGRRHHRRARRRKRPEFSVIVTLRTDDSTVTGEMTILWTLRPNR